MQNGVKGGNYVSVYVSGNESLSPNDEEFFNGNAHWSHSLHWEWTLTLRKLKTLSTIWWLPSEGYCICCDKIKYVDFSELWCAIRPMILVLFLVIPISCNININRAMFTNHACFSSVLVIFSIYRKDDECVIKRKPIHLGRISKKRKMVHNTPFHKYIHQGDTHNYWKKSRYNTSSVLYILEGWIGK